MTLKKGDRVIIKNYKGILKPNTVWVVTALHTGGCLLVVENDMNTRQNGLLGFFDEIIIANERLEKVES